MAAHTCEDSDCPGSASLISDAQLESRQGAAPARAGSVLRKLLRQKPRGASTREPGASATGSVVRGRAPSQDRFPQLQNCQAQLSQLFSSFHSVCEVENPVPSQLLDGKRGTHLCPFREIILSSSALSRNLFSRASSPLALPMRKGMFILLLFCGSTGHLKAKDITLAPA